MANNQDGYEQNVERVRIGTALVAILAGAGLSLGLVTRQWRVTYVFGALFSLCLLVVCGLIVKQCAAVARSSSQPQFSLASLIIATSLLAFFFATIRHLDTPLPCFTAFILLIWFAAVSERQRNVRGTDRSDAPAGDCDDQV